MNAYLSLICSLEQKDLPSNDLFRHCKLKFDQTMAFKHNTFLKSLKFSSDLKSHDIVKIIKLFELFPIHQERCLFTIFYMLLKYDFR
jgi:hypothetical protein